MKGKKREEQSTRIAKRSKAGPARELRDARDPADSEPSANPALPDAPDPKELLSRHGLMAKKGFGQNFLRAPQVHRRIAAACGAKPGDVLVELGGGLGTLTWYLAELGATVICIERDRDLVPILRTVVEPRGVQVVEGNAKTVDYASLCQNGKPLCVAGNIPYQLTSSILFGLIEQREFVRSAALLVQKEVAERIVSPPGDKTYGLLSVVLQAVSETRKVCVVPRGLFHPAPKVDSAVIGLVFKRDITIPESFMPIVRAAFQARRKMLSNALGNFAGANEAMLALGISPTARAETLSAEQYLALSRVLKPGPAH